MQNISKCSSTKTFDRHNNKKKLKYGGTTCGVNLFVMYNQFV